MKSHINLENEALYNARASIGHDIANEIIAGWAARSERTRTTLPSHLGIAYGNSPRQFLDIFPVANKTAPVMLFIHGGYWQALDPRFSSYIAEGLTQLGFCTVIAGYDLCPDVTIKQISDQLRQSVRYLWHQIENYGGDRNAIHVCGHSAGGHLTAEMMVTNWKDIDSTLPEQLIKGGVAISGVFDLSPLIGTTINEKIGLDIDSARVNSPLFLNPISLAPLILAVGGEEGEGFESQSNRLRVHWGKFNPIHRMTLQNCHHLAAVEELSRPGSELIGMIKKTFL